MNRSTLAHCLSVCTALAGCKTVVRPSITVFTKRDFRGDATTLRDAHADLAEEIPDFDRDISSFEINRGTWQVCRKPRFRACRTTDRSMPDLGDWDLDNAIRSLRPVEDE
jgi:hypothetical protein